MGNFRKEIWKIFKKRGDLRTYYRTRDIGGAAEERYIKAKKFLEPYL